MHHRTRPTLQGFTLIELLVVIAIIVALLAILLPSMGKAVELSLRAACASNQDQVHTAVMLIAADRHGALPTLKGAGTDHVSWINHAALMDFQRYVGLDPIKPSAAEPLMTEKPMDVFFCPNRRDWEQNYTAHSTHRMGYYYLFGRGAATALPWPGDSVYEPWTRSARRLTDPGTLILTTDIVEQGTQTPNVTSVSHSRVGYDQGAVGSPVDPSEFDNEGVNTGYLDGSVHWRSHGDLVKHSAREDGQIKGWW